MDTIHSWLRVARLLPNRRLLLFFGLMIASSATEGVGVLLLLPLLDIAIGDGLADGGDPPFPFTVLGDAPGLEVMLGIVLALVAARNGVVFLRELEATRVRQDLVDRLRSRLLAALSAAEWRWISAHRRSNHVTAFVVEAPRIGLGLTFLFGLLTQGATVFVYVGLAMALSWEMTTLAVLGGGLLPWLLAWRRRKVHDLGMEFTVSNQRLQAGIEEGLAGFKVLKGQGGDALFVERVERGLAALRESWMVFQTHSSAAKAVLQVGAVGVLVVYLYLGLVVWPLPKATLITLVLIFARLAPLLAGLQQSAQNLGHRTPALVGFLALVEEAEANAEPPSGTAPVPPLERDIVVRGITLRHAGRTSPALEGVTAVLPAGRVTAVIGPSGAGKSTLVDVLSGVMVPDDGQVLVDGVDLRAIERAAWRKSIAYVPQDVFLFHDTIRANVVWGDEGISSETVRWALEKAAADFVFTLPLGVETIVGDGGIRLSGGERQRLALARAIARHPRLLILDEATSALDRESEERVRDAIDGLRGAMTLVVISHRIRTLERADFVIALERGRLVANGTPGDVESRIALDRFLA